MTQIQREQCEITLMDYAKKCDITGCDYRESQSPVRLQDSRTKKMQSSFQLFRESLGKFGDPNYAWNNHLTIKQWWSQFLRYPELQPLALVAINIFSIQMSSAAVERNFSDFKSQQTKKRNRIESEKVVKLVTVIQRDRACTSEAADHSPVDTMTDYVVLDDEMDSMTQFSDENGEPDSDDIQLLDINDIIHDSEDSQH